MSKLDLITIAIVVVCLLALGYLVYKIYNLMNPPAIATTSIQDSYEGTLADDEATYKDWDNEVDSAGNDVDLDDDELGSAATDEYANETGGALNTNETNTTVNNSDEATDTADLRSESTGDEGNSSSNSTSNDKGATSTAATGDYLVIAGSYRQRANANKQASKLRRKGYSNAEVKIFDKGTYAVIVVDRFNSYSEAKNLVAKLANQGVEAIVDKQ